MYLKDVYEEFRCRSGEVRAAARLIHIMPTRIAFDPDWEMIGAIPDLFSALMHKPWPVIYPSLAVKALVRLD